MQESGDRRKSFLPLGVLFLILTAGWWVLPGDVAGIPLCFFKHLTGLDCPGCGLTRSFLSLARGHFLDAFHFNAAGPLVYLLFLAIFIERAVCLARPHFRLHLAPWVPRYFGVLVVCLLFGHWILRLKNQMHALY